MLNLLSKLLRSPIFYTIIILTIIMLPSVIYKTGESERLAISVLVGLDYKEDKPKEKQLELTLMFLTPQSSSSLEKNFAMATASGQNVSECLNIIEGRIGKEIGLSHCQAIILSDNISKHGPMEYLDSFTRTNDLTTNSLLICSDDPKGLIEAHIQESAKISISLSNLLDYITTHLFTKNNNLEKFYAEYFDESGITYIPYINIKKSSESGKEGNGDESQSESSSSSGDENEGSPNSSSPNDASSNQSSTQSNSKSGADASQIEKNTENSPLTGSQGQVNEEVNFDGTIGIFKKGKLVSKLDKDTTQLLNILYSKEGKGLIQLNNIETQFAKTADLAIEIEDKSQKVSYNFVNGYPVIKFDITLYCKLAEVNANNYTLDTVSVVNAQITDVIKNAMFDEIKSQFSKAINFSKENNVDMFYVAKNFHRLCTKDWQQYKLEKSADQNLIDNVLFLLDLKLVEWT